MSQIAFLAPDEEMLETARAALSHTHPDVLLEKGLLSAVSTKPGSWHGRGWS